MLTIEAGKRLTREVGTFPVLSRGGLLLIVAAGVGDVAVHLLSGAHAGHHGFGLAHLAHLLGVVGMVLVLIGVVADGVRRQFDRRPPAANRRYS